MAASPPTSSHDAAAPVLRARSLVKEFPGVRALDGVSLELGRGEVLGLVGENGAGKSTLIKILGGVYAHGSFSGDVEVAGERRAFGSPRDALAAGVAVVHQELSLVPDMTVADNLVLGNEPRRAGFCDPLRTAAAARAVLDRVLGESAATIDVEAPVSRLGVGVQQLLEIARALASDARVAVLDEPTAALTDGEIDDLFDVVRTRKAEGTAFIYISHRLEEIFALCDRIAVLRDGCLVAVLDAATTDADEIVELMTGKELAELEVERDAALGDTVLHVEHVSLRHPEIPDRQVLSDVSLHVRAGEVVTLAGAMGAGRTALLSSLFGLARAPLTGRVRIGDDIAQVRAPADAIERGVALVPEDRKGAGLVLDMSVTDNLRLASHPRWLRRPTDDERAAAEQREELGIKVPGLAAAVATLSGGNQQKVVLGKWLATQPRLLLLDEPTRGVDVGAKAEIYRLINALVSSGMAVLMASSDLPEVVRMSDRVIVLREGRIAGELARPDINAEAIMQLAVGVRPLAAPFEQAQGERGLV